MCFIFHVAAQPVQETLPYGYLPRDISAAEGSPSMWIIGMKVVDCLDFFLVNGEATILQSLFL